MQASYGVRLTRQLNRYAGMNFALLPIRPPSSDGVQSGKRPLTAHGHRDAVKGWTAVKKAFPIHENCNVAVVTGRRSGLLVLDIDGPVGEATLAKLETKLGKLPDTWVSRTGGGGRHMFFQWPPSLELVRDTGGKLLGDKVDLLGDGSYAVLPPSVHHSGVPYQWCGRGIGQELARLPRSWRKHIRRKQRAPVSADAKVASPKGEVIHEGARNDTLFTLAASCRATGADEAAILSRLVEENAKRCRPPLEFAELERIASSAAKYPQEIEKADIPTLVADACLERHFSNGAHLIAQDGRFYFFCGTHWRILTNDQLKKAALSTLATISVGKKVRTATVLNEVAAILLAKQAADGDPFFDVGSPPQILNVRNGELHLDGTGKAVLKPHSPSSGQRRLMEVVFDPNSTCPLFDEALAAIFSKARDPAGMVRHWHELVGYILQPSRRHAIIPVMFGGGSNGKTKLVDTIVRLMGPDAIHGGVVQDLESSRFGIGALRNKLLFVDDDVKTRVRLPDGTLKKISEAKILTGEEKYKNATTFEVRTVPLLLCNNIPFLQDISHGMLRRIHVLPFDRRFEGEEKDEHLFPRIWAQELPGILNCALSGWRRLQRRGEFELPVDVVDANKKWLREANPFTAFIADLCIRKSDGRVPLKVVYAQFVDWARDSGISRPLTRPQLRQDLVHAGFAVKKSNSDVVVRGLVLRT